MVSKLLTDEDMAALLRCSVSKVRKLRYVGRIAFIPGKPPLVREKDFEAFLEVERRLSPPSSGTYLPPAAPKEPPTEMEKAVARARRTWLLRKAIERRK